MNPILENKLKVLENANDYECWYLVKQPTAFDCLCYLVSFLDEYKNLESPETNLQDYVSKRIAEIKAEKPNVEISNNYRALRVAAFFGLITMTSAKYEQAIITDTFKEITLLCHGEYEKTDLYQDVIQRQIEKMFLSTEIDEEYKGVRQNYRLYPVMLLYKVLLEIGRSTGKYSISLAEYRYLVATTEKFEDFLDTLLLIKLLRDDPDSVKTFEEYRSKFDNRLNQALKQLNTLVFEKDSIAIAEEHLDEVAHKVYLFESNPNVFTANNYLGFLGSTKSLFELEEYEEEELTDLDKTTRISGGSNTLLYGVPGAGKSWTIQHEYCDKDSNVERLVFHPDYTYSDFVGQILPKVSQEQVTYEFTPGPFTYILKKAYTHPTEEYFLVIEEINRGNAPAIFGEVFQLLDRKDENSDEDDGFPIGTSEYGITNADIAREVYGNPNHKVRIPSNLSIIGTMNTSDQNVFTLDTAFQRRWDMRLIENTFDHVSESFRNQVILDTDVTWETFCTEINKIILEKNVRMTSSEDKRLGTYFVKLRDLVGSKKSVEAAQTEIEKAKIARDNARFPEKVLKYLWDDAFKFSREDIFEVGQYNSLEAVIKKFVTSSGNERFGVFKSSVYDSLLNPEDDQDVDDENNDEE